MTGGNLTTLSSTDLSTPRTQVARVEEVVVLLSPPRSFSSVACAMLGQHPQLYGLAETHLLAAETMSEWWAMCALAAFPMAHGLLRSVAQLLFGEQTPSTIAQARAWLHSRSNLTTRQVMEVLAERATPRPLVEKSPLMVYRVEAMERAASAYPRARFIHLTRHPRGHGQSVLKHIRTSVRAGPIPGWLVNLGWSDGNGTTMYTDFDPQRSWYALNSNIDRFLSGLPRDRWKRVAGEALLSDPELTLSQIVGWLGLRTDAEAIEAMKHPEHSPFASLGPLGARYGNDVFFLRSPRLRPDRAAEQSLDGVLEWRTDGKGFLPEVAALAQSFGYR